MMHSPTEKPSPVYTLDLNFLANRNVIASYLIPHSGGAILIESGPGSTIPGLTQALKEHGFTPQDVSDVFVTHIHLDHAGASGWLARQGATIHVHPVGAAHLIDPERLLISAGRIYGDQMEYLWGEFLPVPEDQVAIIRDGDEVEINGRVIRAVDTPGHAYHHHTYIYGKLAFSGDIGGIRMQPTRHVRVPMPPPEFHLELWRESVAKLRRLEIEAIAPTHFGIFNDAQTHLGWLANELDAVDDWMKSIMPAEPPVDEIDARFQAWMRQRSLADALDETQIQEYELANPSFMSAPGMQRYWRKHRITS